jgi:hypothetical protein
MAFKYNQVAVPFCQWSGEAPSHKITCSTFAGDHGIATGSLSGLICLWSWDAASLELSPRVILVGHKAPISSLVYDEYYGNPCVVSGALASSLRVQERLTFLCSF